MTSKNKIETKLIPEKYSYLSEVIDKLPSNVLLNKGITGCGGTTVELESKRNSILLFPTIELVENKIRDTDLAVMGGVSLRDINRYLNSNIKNKKIISTYDGFTKLLEFNLYDWFLLIDEYHLLFNYYSFRNKAILPILSNYKKFQDYCFMTATPLTGDNLLEELEDIPIINLKWENSVPVNIKIIDTYFTNKSLITECKKYPDDNYHIFLNSVKTITSLVKQLGEHNCKIVCSKSQKLPDNLIISSTKDPVKKYNFYTSTAFEGQDIYDEKGRTFILSDTSISSTMMDISTLVVQICGRLRNSKYKNEATLILNTRTHRYANIPFPIFENNVNKNKESGQIAVNIYNDNIINPKFNREDVIETEKKKFNADTYFNIYLNIKDDLLILDNNLIKTDYSNYRNVNDIYSSSINVINTYKEHFNVIESEIKISTEDNSNQTSEFSKWHSEYAYLITPLLTKSEYTFDELSELFSDEFLNLGIKFTRSTVKKYFPPYETKRQMKNKVKSTYYAFKM